MRTDDGLFYAERADGGYVRGLGFQAHSDEYQVEVAVPMPQVLLPGMDGFLESIEKLELVVDVPAGAHFFRNIYEPATPFGDVDMYGLCMYSELLPPWLLPSLRIKPAKPEVGLERSYLVMNSKKQPRVGRGPADARALLHQLELLGAENRPKDHLFEGERLRLHLRGFWFSPPRSVASMMSRSHPTDEHGRFFKLVVERVELPDLPEAPPTVADLVNLGFDAAVRRVIAESEGRARTRR